MLDRRITRDVEFVVAAFNVPAVVIVLRRTQRLFESPVRDRTDLRVRVNADLAREFKTLSEKLLLGQRLSDSSCCLRVFSLLLIGQCVPDPERVCRLASGRKKKRKACANVRCIGCKSFDTGWIMVKIVPSKRKNLVSIGEIVFRGLSKFSKRFVRAALPKKEVAELPARVGISGCKLCRPLECRFSLIRPTCLLIDPTELDPPPVIVR
jgi:hypothetical protein